MTFRSRTSSRQREELWKAEATKAVEAKRGEYPICPLCDLPVTPGSLWDESHEKHKPRWLGGVVDGCAHRRCNRIWNNTHDTPLFAKNERVRKKHLDLKRPDTPLPGGREDYLKKKLNGQVVRRGREEQPIQAARAGSRRGRRAPVTLMSR